MNQDIDKIKSKHYSYSKINTFFNCPHQYKLIYIDKIYNNSESIEAFMGKIVHSVLEWTFKEKVDFALFDTLVEKYHLEWENKWHADIFLAKIHLSKQYYYKLGIECLRNFYRNYNNNCKQIKDVKTEVLVESKFKGHLLKGIIDRVDIYENSVYIHDYKTGKPMQKQKIKNNLQLFIYYLITVVKYPNKKITLNWHYLKKRKDQTISIIYDKDSIEKLKLELEDKIKEIELSTKKNNFDPKESFLCNWCYYWKECNAKNQYNLSNPSLRMK